MQTHETQEQEQQVIQAMEEREMDDLSAAPRFEDDRALALYKMRHSAAHIMAEAVLDVFPEAKLAIGPPIEDGFYYDFDLPRALTPEDLAGFEELMARRIAADDPFVREVISYEAARELFKDQPYKLELIEDHRDEEITLYRDGPFVDLCRGPHVARTGEVKAFKLTSVAGAYWRGDERRPMLQRIYGTAWPSQEELEAYLQRVEEARRRDHRKLGRELGLFVFADDVGPGLPLFLPKGEMLRYLMESYVRETQTRYGYQHVWTAHMVKEALYKKSGHLDHYSDALFPPMDDEGVRYRLKPVNCPSHMTLYKESGLKSYRDLPLRFAEFCTLYRYEKSGELTGLTRVRSVTQDDCHIFCTPEQINDEFGRALDLVREVLDTYGFTDYRVRLSLRDPGDTQHFIADDERWDAAERALRGAMDSKGMDYFVGVGEAAIYGPKADFLARDVLGREWQLSTIQVDFIQPARLGLEYIGEDNKAHTPVVIHRAVTGSTERFLGVLIEHYAGAFPVWLAPVQAVVLPISDGQAEYGDRVAAMLRGRGLRVEVDGRNERLQYKIREAQLQKVPYMLVVGKREAENHTAAVRLRSGEDLGPRPLEEIAERIATEAAERIQ
jgi:threonyl-tRNA synthetase